MGRIIIVSNRLPITIHQNGTGFSYRSSAGGLATGLNSMDRSLERVWVGWPGEEITLPAIQEQVLEDLIQDGLVPVFLSKKEIELYYEGFSNKTIWPHFHYFTQYTTYQDDYWEAYSLVNQKFADAIKPILQPDDLVWVHDYQLMLLPAMIREFAPQTSIGFFLHIPFPSYEIFRVLPWREALLKGVLGADQIGFHTFGYMRHFLSAAYRLGGYEHLYGKLRVGHRLINVDVFPMGIDYEKYAHPEIDLYANDDSFKIKQLARNKRIIVSIDRLDYTKGIPQRIKAFEQFIERYPEYIGKVSLVLIAVPSRSNVDNYRKLKQSIDTLVGKINSAYGSFDWMPIQYLYRSLNFNELSTLYQVADIAMITPLRDGMNLVAKEYIAAKDETKRGVLILSEMAGAANELSSALLVNPHDINKMAEVIQQALEMNENEQVWRMETMQQHLKRYNVRHWANTFVQEQKRLMEQQQAFNNMVLLQGTHRNTLLERYRAAQNRLIILDYDGTLMSFHPDPQSVAPDTELMRLLSQLSSIVGNKLIINSGRDHQTLQAWLGPLGIDMAGEHGVWIKRNGQWKINPGLSNTWKADIRPVLEHLVERTPGSFVEEKDYSLAWHYRRIDRDLGEKRVREIRDGLLYITANLDLQVLEGNKVVEVKHASVSKGKATLSWLNEQDWDFVLAIGDDQTDEDTFRVLPEENSYTVKVGLEQSAARYTLANVEEVRVLLGELVKAGF
ncbi:bifunctional alpha,alpha-trehalose-phosphate synthase (UDP-forming)/trehalose-phosphatase [Haliscomenobacter hydrossis]|uniref:Alpha,alpha-trehalose-phosphate synthase n=1 Tax=Haliscomenobacter hydrossis (strain ATCC 27775 / DSM 1100 / LMG 10767 / O) TaxID=760192 RepID=F4L394_HALH1|nr:bifunctional alpha,alpha-trehalose-phosphate synthase (UDP-forming)/trehalose-phosphatase [Haliscomenobacter hydrossis]AEE51728.1 trehalose-phosphatase [Haliscomenobacter hydrossis DSM 1100]